MAHAVRPPQCAAAAWRCSRTERPRSARVALNTADRRMVGGKPPLQQLAAKIADSCLRHIDGGCRLRVGEPRPVEVVGQPPVVRMAGDGLEAPRAAAARKRHTRAGTRRPARPRCRGRLRTRFQPPRARRSLLPGARTSADRRPSAGRRAGRPWPAPTIRSLMSPCLQARPYPFLPTSMRSTCGGAKASTSAETSWSCRTTSAACSARSAFSVRAPDRRVRRRPGSRGQSFGGSPPIDAARCVWFARSPAKQRAPDVRHAQQNCAASSASGGQLSVCRCP